jgi:hypothetical protein
MVVTVTVLLRFWCGTDADAMHPQGDYYHYTALSAADQERVQLNGYYYNKDSYGIMYKVSMSDGLWCCGLLHAAAGCCVPSCCFVPYHFAVNML